MACRRVRRRTRDGVPIINIDNPTQAVLIVPAARFKRGASCDWRLTTRKARDKASFERLDADETIAAIFDEAELFTARDLVLDDIKRQLAP